MSVDDSPKMRRRSFWLWFFAVALLVLVAAVTLTVISFQSMSSGRLADAMKAADRDDPNWRLEDLMAHREQVPTGENSAPVVATAAALLSAEWSLETAVAAGTSKPGDKTTSSAVERLKTIHENVRLDDALAVAIRNELKARAGALAIARTVADFDRGRHELVVGPAVTDMPLDETQGARIVARLLAADAAIRANDGDLDGAVESCRAIIATSRSIGDEPTLISSLVRIAIDSQAMTTTSGVLGKGEPSEAALARLQTLVLDEGSQPVLLNGMKGERAMLIELIQRVEAGEVPFSVLTGDAKAPAKRARRADQLVDVLARGFLGGQQAVALEWMNEAVSISRRPVFQQRDLWAAWGTKIAAVAGSGLGRFRAILPLLLVPGASAASMAAGRVQSELGATAILIAAERHRRRTGKWPASIKEIDSSILPTPPVDPFTGEPFHLEHRDGQLFIYSIGPNGKDEHGAHDPKRRMSGGPDDVGARAWDVKLRGLPAEQEDE
jgi:hypothetical protein